MRRKRNIKREIIPDPKYGNQMIAKFINYVMRKGKKTVAQKVVYKTFDVLEKKYKVDPVATFDLAIKNASPLLEIKARRIGGATYQVPREVRGERKMQLAYTWILNSARSKKGKPMAEKLAEELFAASKGEGNAIKKKMDTHRMAEANKAFAHFAW
ncbi:MAG: 30S ribosomal protein S7 [Candidatus Sungbacteria bacterium RIFCSPLOWO2_01_FULL_47_32]|nr:MAG: 30S ribosomal protein S7 [Candidatus Sungbacteria bacterium RIFCSPLOWO2_01_FULL_47_32]